MFGRGTVGFEQQRMPQKPCCPTPFVRYAALTTSACSATHRDLAMELVLGLIPPPSPERLRRAVSSASAHALSRGVTTVGDMGRALGPQGHPSVWSDFEQVSPRTGRMGAREAGRPSEGGG